MCCNGNVEPDRMESTETAAFYNGLLTPSLIITWKILDYVEEDFKLNPKGCTGKLQIISPIKRDEAVTRVSLLKVKRYNCKLTSKSFYICFEVQLMYVIVEKME